MSALAKLVSELIVIVAGFGIDAAGGDAPDVRLVSQHVIAAEVCDRPCAVLAVFDPEKGILLDSRLDPLNDLNARSILLHELIHFLQWKATGRVAQGCAEWLRRESQAYEVQFAWLSRQTKGERRFPLRRPILPPVLCAAKL